MTQRFLLPGNGRFPAAFSQWPSALTPTLSFPPPTSPETYKAANLLQCPQDTADPSASLPSAAATWASATEGSTRQLPTDFKEHRKSYISQRTILRIYLVIRMNYILWSVFRHCNIQGLADPRGSAPRRVSQFLERVNDPPASVLFKCTPPNPEPTCPNQPRARHPSTRDRPSASGPLKLFKPAKPEPAYPPLQPHNAGPCPHLPVILDLPGSSLCAAHPLTHRGVPPPLGNWQ